jgi:hypothetical protein
MWHVDPLRGKDREKKNETTAVVRQWSARQWTGWEEVFSAQSAPMASHAIVDTKMKSDVLYAVRVDGL